MTQNMNELEKAFDLLHQERELYKKNYFKMWVWTLIGIILALFLAPNSMNLFAFLEFSFFSRTGLDSVTESKIGSNTTWDDIIVNDLLITSFDYNSQ